MGVTVSDNKLTSEEEQDVDESTMLTQEISPKKKQQLNDTRKRQDAFPSAGESFGKYEQLEEIGKGASATVFKANDPNLNRWVALKVLCAGSGYAEEMQQRFRQEMEILANLSIYGITAIFEQGEIDGYTYFAME
jgi:serine/threonine protein kinase